MLARAAGPRGSCLWIIWTSWGTSHGKPGEFPSHIEGNQIPHSGFAHGSTRSWNLPFKRLGILCSLFYWSFLQFGKFPENVTKSRFWGKGVNLIHPRELGQNWTFPHFGKNHGKHTNPQHSWTKITFQRKSQPPNHGITEWLRMEKTF